MDRAATPSNRDKLSKAVLLKLASVAVAKDTPYINKQLLQAVFRNKVLILIVYCPASYYRPYWAGELTASGNRPLTILLQHNGAFFLSDVQ